MHGIFHTEFDMKLQWISVVGLDRVKEKTTERIKTCGNSQNATTYLIRYAKDNGV